MRRPVSVLVPVKEPRLGKSRLGLSPPVRRALAAAFAADTVGAALAVDAVEEVVVLCSDPALADELTGAGARVCPDPVPGDLNATLLAALALVPRAAVLVALCADLPSLRPRDLAAVLAAYDDLPDPARAFVPDASATGTTTYLADRDGFRPRFGPDSAEAHDADGAVRLGVDLPSVRADVDDRAALARAVTLGVGPRTAEVLARSSW